tara:strand:+ start:165 stop:272 length:108 start_codon:yes stop_codon:yes gene_type:complete
MLRLYLDDQYIIYGIIIKQIDITKNPGLFFKEARM